MCMWVSGMVMAVLIPRTWGFPGIFFLFSESLLSLSPSLVYYPTHSTLLPSYASHFLQLRGCFWGYRTLKGIVFPNYLAAFWLASAQGENVPAACDSGDLQLKKIGPVKCRIVTTGVRLALRECQEVCEMGWTVQCPWRFTSPLN